MSSAPDYFDSANDVEKGHAPTLDTSFAMGSPVQLASNDPLSPTFGATFSPRMSPVPLGLDEPHGTMHNISLLTLSNPLHLNSTQHIPSASIPNMSLDSPGSGIASPTETATSPLASSHHSQATLTLTPSSDDDKMVKLPGSPVLDEKKTLGLADMKVVDIPEVGYEKSLAPPAPAPAAPAAPPPPAKIEATRRIKFLLWFNTYRYATALTCMNGPPLTSLLHEQEVLHCRGHL